MSKDIVVLAPNGRRQTIHCSADTSILQVLEDVCKKQGFQPSDYDLKHHNRILDLSTTVRFSNLPNKATVEMVEAQKSREECNVTVGLLLEDGERRTADFLPNTSLYDIISSLAAPELNGLLNPCILYMRQEVTGETALRGKTLRMMGLIKGRAILRLLNKADEAKQANVSAVYRVPLSENVSSKENKTQECMDTAPGPSNKLDPIALIRSVKNPKVDEDVKMEQDSIQDEDINEPINEKPVPVQPPIKQAEPPSSVVTQESLERRLNIEDEVTFLGAQKAIVFMQPDDIQDDIADLPDDFYDLTIEEVRKLYHDLQQNRIVLEHTPLMTSSQREELERQSSHHKVNEYKNAVVRIQFPDGIILQGIFQPSNSVQDVINFVKEHLRTPEKPFHIFTTPLKVTFDPKMTLLEAKLVPCVHMHFKWLEEDAENNYLKAEIYSMKTSSDAASMLASKYRAPSRRKIEPQSSAKPNIPSTSKNSKMPKWFKN